MFNGLVKIRIANLLVLFAFVYAVLAIVIKGHGFEHYTDALLSAASFLYGILIGFAISKSQEKLSTVNNLLKVDEAHLSSIYRLSGEFGEKTTEEVRKLIDNHLIEQIDFKLIDFDKSGSSFHGLYNYILTLRPETKKQETLYSQMITLLNEMSSNRKRVETTIHDKISGYEWTSLIALMTLSGVLILDLNINTTFSIVASTTLATIAFSLLLILRDLNNLRWKVQDWIWEPLHNLFISLDLLPYYSEFVLEYGDARPPKGSKIRVGRYKNPYPDMSEKTIEEITVGE